MTPPPHASVLEGITRQVILEIAQNLGIQVDEKELTLHDLYNADEAFFASTSLEVQTLIEIDGRLVGNGIEGSTTRKIREKFEQIKRSEGTSVWEKD